MILITIETENAAFESDPAYEVGMVLRKIAGDFISMNCEELPQGRLDWPVYDFNNQICGKIEGAFTEED